MKHQFGCPQIHIISKKGLFFIAESPESSLVCRLGFSFDFWAWGSTIFLMPLEFHLAKHRGATGSFYDPPNGPRLTQLTRKPHLLLMIKALAGACHQAEGRLCIFGGQVTRIHQLYLTPHSCWTYVCVYIYIYLY